MQNISFKKGIVFAIVLLFFGVGIVSNAAEGMILEEKVRFDGTVATPGYIDVLAFFPKSHDFGYIHEGESYQTTFDIWNNGTGTLIWNLETFRPWISFSPTSGSSTGENTLITVTINTTGLSPGNYEASICITSDGGNGCYEAYAGLSHPPATPIINGPVSGKVRNKYCYTLTTTDLDGDNIYYYVEWGDNIVDGIGWIGPCESGEAITINHTWNKRGDYCIKAKAKDIHDTESEWASLDVSMPKNVQLTDGWVFQFLERLWGFSHVLSQLLCRQYSCFWMGC